MRTQDEIVERVNQIQADNADLLGFRCVVLICALDYEHAKAFVKSDVTKESWEQDEDAPLHLTEEQIRKEGLDYLQFAFGKASDHRGISAGRSVEKMTEFAWLLGLDDIVTAMEKAEYQNYGVPKLKVFADALDIELPSEDLKRMAEGLPCEPGCPDGCGS